MKKFLILGLLFVSIDAKADHITGGEMYYTHVSFSGGVHEYSFTLKLYMRCNSGRMFPNPAVVSVFDRSSNLRLLDLMIDLNHQERISLPSAGPCISNPPEVCYDVAYYYFTVSLPPSEQGYLLSSQVNYRINGLSNLNPSQVGATYTCEIPGNIEEPTASINNSAHFTGSDLVIVCASNFFSYSFSASDPDGDQLRYSFCSAYNSSTGAINGAPSGEPPYQSLPYASPDFSGSSPLGGTVSIDPNSGLITGIAPVGGMYVVTVCVEEVRSGKVIATQRKDIQINVADCELAAATLQPDYMLCGSSQRLTISNMATSPLITSQNWEIRSLSGEMIFSSTQTVLDYTFTASGTYLVRLIVNRQQECADSTESRVYVYPGFEPDFTYTGICITKPTNFQDLSTTVTGTVNSWNWDFGDLNTSGDISILQNPTYTYPGLGTRNVRLIVTNTDGCRDTIIKPITIIDKPPLNFAFRDTLICRNDQLQLQSGGMGAITWSPTTYLTNPNSHTPIVSPPVTTVFYADLDSDGCLNRDSVIVRVVEFVSLSVMPDTTVCSGDSIRLRITSDGLKFAWTPAGQLIDPTAREPIAITPLTTNYAVTATIGGCSTTERINVTAVPYPIAELGSDTLICFGTSAQLHAITDGQTWEWHPSATLTNPSSLNPIAQPDSTTSYIFLAFEHTRGCPKPGHDTIVVTMLDPIIASAGGDTSVVIGQPLQLQASGGVSYSWSPTGFLSSSVLADPVAIFNFPSEGLLYTVTAFNEAGCEASDEILIKVFATEPMVFVPTAFTPNNDGLNDELRPIAAGIAIIEYFQVFNRWGQLVYRSNSANPVWDGRVNGQIQGNNTFVWHVKAVDYKGNAYYQKGTVTLIK